MTMNKFMADVDDLIFDGQEQSHSLLPSYIPAPFRCVRSGHGID